MKALIIKDVQTTWMKLGTFEIASVTRDGFYFTFELVNEDTAEFDWVTFHRSQLAKKCRDNGLCFDSQDIPIGIIEMLIEDHRALLN